MDPRNRLWSELIFPRCNLNDLLALRAVCRGLRDQLNAWRARLWSQALQDVRRMTCAERQLGWRGVECARERERVTRANCDAGVFAAGAVLTLPSSVTELRCVAGRIVAFDEDTVQVFDAESGALLATHAVSRFGLIHVVQDRWVVFAARDTWGIYMVDCADSRVTTYTPPDTRDRFFVHCVSGARVLYTPFCTEGATLLHISADAEGATVVRVVAHVECALGEAIELCQRGRSMLRIGTGRRLRLCSVATGSTIRFFDLPDNIFLRRLFVYGSCDFVCASTRSTDGDSGLKAVVVFRLSDGASLAPFKSRSVDPVVVDGGRSHVPTYCFSNKYALVDATTLAVSALPDVAQLWADHSGALLWRRRGVLVAASAFDSGGTAVRGAKPEFTVLDFSYGVAVVRDGTTCRVWRFDRGAAADAAEPPFKVSYCVSGVARHRLGAHQRVAK